MDRTCRWTLTPGSPQLSPVGLPNAWPKPIMMPDGCLRRRSATEPAANTRAFPARCRSAPLRCELLLVEFGRSAASWAGRLVFVNGHGGNVEALAAATALLRYEGRDVALVLVRRRRTPTRTPDIPKRLYCYIFRRSVVRLDEMVPGNSAPLAELLPAMRNGGVAAVSELGVLGDPTTATATDGDTPVCRDGGRVRRPDQRAGSRTATGC